MEGPYGVFGNINPQRSKMPLSKSDGILKETLKILDTFAGIGGFSYVAYELVGGFETTQFVEIDPFVKSFKKHFPKVPRHDDIKTFQLSLDNMMSSQDRSTPRHQCGRKKRRNYKTTRSGLFYELIRVIRLVRPKYVVMENV